jgi:hypothetical protein
MYSEMSFIIRYCASLLVVIVSFLTTTRADARSVTCELRHSYPYMYLLPNSKWAIRELVHNGGGSLHYQYTWYNNAERVSSIPTNAYSIVFQEHPFLTTPSELILAPLWAKTNDIRLSVMYFATFTGSGFLAQQYGVLLPPRIMPEDAGQDSNKSATFYQGYGDNGGLAFSYKPPGVYTAAFPSITGWITPPPQVIHVVAGQMITYTGVYQAVDLGTRLTVEIEPPSLRNSARWYITSQRLANGYESGRTLTHLTPGSYTVRFVSAPGFDAPSDMEVTIDTNQPQTICGVYTPTAYPVQGILRTDYGTDAPEAARWAIVGEVSTGLVWRSLYSVGYCTVGSTVTFSHVDGWITPSNVVVNRQPWQGTLQIVGTYSASPDAKAAFTMMLYPSYVADNGGRWGIRSGSNVTWYTSGTSLTNLEPGTLDITFAEIEEPGWFKPADYSVILKGNEQAQHARSYSAVPVAIHCEITPAEAADAGAKWALSDEHGVQYWLTNGATFSGQPGSYAIVFKSLTGWTKPEKINFFVGPGDSKILAGRYERLKDDGILQVWWTPSNPPLSGAGWRLDSSSRAYGNGALLTNLSVGAHTITFCDVPGYIAPKPIDFQAAPAERHSFSAVYQRGHQMNIRVLLEGPLQANQRMRCLQQVPANSPYIADPRTASFIPSNAVDWVLIQLSAGTNLVPYFSRSAFLRQDGWVVDDQGLPGITVQFKGGTNWLVIQHRNHLAVMSAAPLDPNTYDHTNDFTRSEFAYYGGNAAAKPAHGLWCMVAGDTDGDGMITELDRTMIGQLQTSGVCRADVDMTMSVDGRDVAFRSNNLGRVSQASCAVETILDKQMVLSAEYQTVLSYSTTWVHHASTDYGFDHAGFIMNSSRATIALHPHLIQYVAGSGVGLDRLQTWNSNDYVGRIALHVVSRGMATHAGKAVLLAGTSGREDPNTAATHYLAEKAYSTLQHRGFSSEQIQYLSFRSSSSSDGLITRASVANAITNWAKASEKLVLYFVDHGNISAALEPYFRLNATENLMAHELDAMLDDLQESCGTEVVVVIDCCRAGAFQNALQYQGQSKRVVITSCGADEPSYFVAGGQISFSDAFFTSILVGHDLGTAFSMATNAMSAYQQGAMTPAEASQDLVLGQGSLQECVGPHIGEVCPDQTLTDRSSAILWARSIVSPVPLKRVWCTIVPPNNQPGVSNPVSQVAQTELQLNEQGEFEGVYGGFSQQGAYRILFYAEDVLGRVSLPMETKVIQAGFDERAILVVAGETNGMPSLSSLTLASLAYQTLRARSIPKANISLLFPYKSFDADQDGQPDVWGAPSGLNLQAALNASFSSAQKLTLYLLGNASHGEFCLNRSETLSSDTLDYLLDQYQVSNRLVITLLDFENSGAFAANMKPPDGRQRINIASTSALGASLCQSRGLVSFSQFFFSHILLGRTLGEAFEQTRRAMFNAAGPLLQTAWLNDDGDGASNTKDLDGVLASGSCIGAAFLTGADLPEIHHVSASALVTNGSGVSIWAADVTAALGVSNVWCVMTPPNYRNGDDLPSLELSWNENAGRYEATVEALTEAGTYTLTFLAKDTAGQVSLPVQSRLHVADAFEPDNAATQAVDMIVGSAQVRNFHSQKDEDWIRFFAFSNTVFSIEAEQLETNVDVRLQVYYQKPDGSLTNLSFLTQDHHGKGTGLVESVDLNFITFPQLKSGVYFVRASSAAADGWGWDSGYRLRVSIPCGIGVVVAAVDMLRQTGVPSSSIWVDGVFQCNLDGRPYVNLDLAEGWHLMEIRVPGNYMSLEDPNLDGQVTNPSSSYGNPRWIYVSNSQAPFVGFQFMPFIVLAGSVRDKWTGAPLDNTRLSFVARDGLIAGLRYDGYPAFATYKRPWWTGTAGQFPDQVILPAVHWDLTLSRDHYCTNILINILPSLGSGRPLNVGPYYLVPEDRDANKIGDAWQTRCFMAPGPVQPQDDYDQDGQSNQQEYLLNTDPTDAHSFFFVETSEAIGSDQGAQLVLTWPTAPGRVYRINACGQLQSGSWTCLAGPWTADVQTTSMTWTNHLTAVGGASYYRVLVTLPDP